MTFIKQELLVYLLLLSTWVLSASWTLQTDCSQSMSFAAYSPGQDFRKKCEAFIYWFNGCNNQHWNQIYSEIMREFYEYK